MYLAIVVLLMLVLPVGSIFAESAILHSAVPLPLLIGKWFVFWSVGVRLLLAGLRQIANPAFTAQTIFDVKDKAALTIVQELGFGNLSIGLIGALSLVNAGWIVPAAIAAAAFYGLAGMKHLIKSERNALETIAMISDLFIFVVLAGDLAVTLNPA
ncbi:MAG: hypothetical protein ACLQE9_10035 [Roseiarcus sp.]